MTEDPPIPALLDFLLCDQIISEAVTNKKSLIGVFDRIWVPQVPAIHLQHFWIYARLADAEGNYTFRIEIVKLDSGRQIGRIDTNATTAKDRLANADIVIKIPPIPLEELGTYEFQLYANNVWIGRTTMTVAKAEPGGPKP